MIWISVCQDGCTVFLICLLWCLRVWAHVSEVEPSLPTLVLLNCFPHQAASFSARRASSCNTPRPFSSGCSAASLCCFTGPSPLSSPACPGTQWPSWPGEERWGLAGENTKWTLCRCPVRTHSHTLTLTLTPLRTCLYCSLSATVASHTPVFALRTLMVTLTHFQSGGCCRVDSTLF